MSDAPWFRFFPNDWLSGCAGLSAAERGVYITLVALMYDAGGNLPRDDARLSRQCGLPLVSFRRSLKGLMDAGKVIDEEGTLTNRRVKIELSERGFKILRASKAASSRYEKTKQNQSEVHAGALREQCASTADAGSKQDERVPPRVSPKESFPVYNNINNPFKEITPSFTPSQNPSLRSGLTPACAREAEFRQAVVSAYQRSGSMHFPDTHRVALWIERGYRQEVAIPVIEEILARKPNVPLKYFDQALAEAHAAPAPIASPSRRRETGLSRAHAFLQRIIDDEQNNCGAGGSTVVELLPSLGRA